MYALVDLVRIRSVVDIRVVRGRLITGFSAKLILQLVHEVLEEALWHSLRSIWVGYIHRLVSQMSSYQRGPRVVAPVASPGASGS